MNIEQHNFITQYLRHSSAYTAYCIAYNVEDQSQYEIIMSAAQQLMDDPDVGGVIRSVLDGVRYDVEQEIRAQQKTELLTIQRKRELLTNIATGEMYAIQNYKGKDCNQCTQMVRPTIHQMLKAIDLDSKLAGHYSVDKRALTVDNSQLTMDSTEMECNTRKDDNLSLPFSGIGGNPQQNATKEQNPLPVRGLGKAEKKPESQQNTTIHLSPAGGDVHIQPVPQSAAGVVDSQRTENTPETQQNTTIHLSILAG